MLLYVNELNPINRFDQNNDPIPRWDSKTSQEYFAADATHSGYYMVNGSIWRCKKTHLATPEKNLYNTDYWEQIPEMEVGVVNDPKEYHVGDIVQCTYSIKDSNGNVTEKRCLAECKRDHYVNLGAKYDETDTSKWLNAPFMSTWDPNKLYKFGSSTAKVDNFAFWPVYFNNKFTTYGAIKNSISYNSILNINPISDDQKYWISTKIAEEHNDTYYGLSGYRVYRANTEIPPRVTYTGPIDVYRKSVLVWEKIATGINPFIQTDSIEKNTGESVYYVDTDPALNAIYLSVRSDEEFDNTLYDPSSRLWDREFAYWEELAITIGTYSGTYKKILNKKYKIYNIDDLVTHNGYIYRCKKRYTQREGDPTYEPDYPDSQYWTRILPMYSFDKIGVVNDDSSMIWIDRYREEGTFELETPLNKDNYDLFKIGRYVTKDNPSPDLNENGITCMIIEHVESGFSSEKGEIMKVSGRDLKSILDRRIAFPMSDFTAQSTFGKEGGLALAMIYLVENYFISPEKLERENSITGESQFAFPERRTDIITVSPSDVESLTDGLIGNAIKNGTINRRYKEDNILDIMNELCEKNNVGYRILLKPGDYSTNPEFVFTPYSGVDHSYTRANQNDSLVVYSRSFGNLQSSTFKQDSKEYKNVGFCFKEKDSDRYINLNGVGVDFNENGSIKVNSKIGNTLLNGLFNVVKGLFQKDTGRPVKNIVRAFVQAAGTGELKTVKIGENTQDSLSFTVTVDGVPKNVYSFSNSETADIWWGRFVKSTNDQWLTPTIVSNAFSQTAVWKVGEKLIGDEDGLSQILGMYLNQYATTSGLIHYLYQVEGNTSGLNRREVAVDEEKDNEKWSESKTATFTQSTGTDMLTTKADDEESDEDILKRLRRSARHGLSKHRNKDDILAELAVDDQFVFGKDYGLGDIIQIDDGYNKSKVIVTEYAESRDKDGNKSYPSFEKFKEIPSRFSPLKSLTFSKYLTDVTPNELVSYNKEEAYTSTQMYIKSLSYEPEWFSPFYTDYGSIMEYHIDGYYDYGDVVEYTVTVGDVEKTLYYVAIRDYDGAGNPDLGYPDPEWFSFVTEYDDFRTIIESVDFQNTVIEAEIGVSTNNTNSLFGARQINTKALNFYDNVPTYSFEYQKGTASDPDPKLIVNNEDNGTRNIFNNTEEPLNRLKVVINNLYQDGIAAYYKNSIEYESGDKFEDVYSPFAIYDMYKPYVFGFGKTPDGYYKIDNPENYMCLGGKAIYDGRNFVGFDEFDTVNGVTVYSFKIYAVPAHLYSENSYICSYFGGDGDPATSRYIRVGSTIDDPGISSLTVNDADRVLVSDLRPVIDQDLENATDEQTISDVDMYGFYDVVKMKFSNLKNHNNNEAIYIDNGGILDE